MIFLLYLSIPIGIDPVETNEAYVSHANHLLVTGSVQVFELRVPDLIYPCLLIPFN
jgi:hypothetical protein